jgi:hypothetical protein
MNLLPLCQPRQALKARPRPQEDSNGILVRDSLQVNEYSKEKCAPAASASQYGPYQT